ncbi:type IV toxin-antitoxin system AbiEi family antitoxin domain-containing protein [Clavibacter sp. CFBP 8614]|uniref:type IV toxin-antitoxin system AbiEi family antitoxin domain-containing protein n=1 Tax=unclassified Clavibacter TaxID=2626594 RepID=UPI00404293C8
MATQGTRTLEELASEQWGLVTAAQASAAGVARSTLTRRESSGSLERIRNGVYKVSTSAMDGRDDLRAAWLASTPAVPARERRRDPDVVVGGAASAWVHEMGDVKPAPFTFWTRARKQTRATDVRFRVSDLPPADVTVVDGLPVTTRERTLADLLETDGSDLSLVADALGDAERSRGDLDVPALISHLERRAPRLGFVDGAALYRRLRALSGVDGRDPEGLTVHADLAQRFIRSFDAQLEEVLAPLRADERRIVRAAMLPVHDAIASMARGLQPLMSRELLSATPAALAGTTAPTFPRSTIDELVHDALRAATRSALEEEGGRTEGATSS